MLLYKEVISVVACASRSELYEVTLTMEFRVTWWHVIQTTGVYDVICLLLACT